MDPRIELTLEIIKHNLAKPLSVAEISGQVGLSVSRFEHLLKAETGRTYKTLVEEARMEKAPEFLLDPTRGVSEVAFAVGYNFLPNFTRDFRKRFGTSPSRYRTLLVAGFAKK